MNSFVGCRLFKKIVDVFIKLEMSQKTGEKARTLTTNSPEVKNSKEPTVATNTPSKCEKMLQNLQVEIINDIDGCKIWIPILKSYVFLNRVV